MSAITAGRFTGKQRQKKIEVAQTFANVVYHEIQPQNRYNGISTISTTGPNVRGHRKELSQVLGTIGKLHVVENDPKVFTMIKRNVKRLNDDRVMLHKGNVLELCTQVLHALCCRAYLDLDLCRTFWALAKEGLLEDLREISQRFKHFDQVWLALTFCRRRSVFDVNTIADLIIENWIGKELQLCCGPVRYSDGAPMVTYLFRAV